MSLSAHLAAAAENPRKTSPEYGAEVRAWLEMQASGSLAAPSPRQPGDAASRTYQRYLKSFERPIPESYFGKQEGFVNR
jgi:hypothetical protein